MTHVLDKFKFCPVCGSPNFEINNIKSKKCKDCGFSYYLNPSSATVAFILNERKKHVRPLKGDVCALRLLYVLSL